MDDIVTNARDDLYEADFYAWTREQARLLKAGRASHADLTNIIEEIESLGRQQIAELRSRLRVLAHHLLKEMFQPEKASRSWATTIVVQRQNLKRHILDNPSLKAKTSEVFAQAYADARQVVATETGMPLAIFPNEPPFTFAQATDASYWPGRTIDDRA